MAEKGETKYCTNCKRDISANNFVMHEVHCKRNITLCKHCQEPVPTKEMDEHFEANHKQVPCEKCQKLLEKNSLEKHLENECSKRIVRCPYCEIDLPQSSLSDHIDFCGSRTEQCVKCQQYIQKKDNIQHELSNCSYPQPKPPDNSNTNIGMINQLLADDDMFRLGPEEPYLNSFSFDEMSRILSSSQHPDERLMGRMSNSYTEGSSSGSGASRIRNNTQRTLKNKNKDQEMRNKTNKKSDLNRHRDLNRELGQSSSDHDNTDDYDRLLAMHLAQDLNESDGDLEDIIRRLEKDTSNTRQPDNIETSNTNRPPADEFLPCEFCDEIFSLDMLATHQSSCQSDPLGSIADPSDLNNQLDTLRNNNRQILEVPVERNNISPIISPVGEEITNDWWPNAVASDRGLLEEEQGNFCLPCEFCHEPFPIDMLVQHQSVCDSTEPQSSHSTIPKRRTTLLNNRIANSISPPPNSRRHQAAPGLDNLSFDVLDDVPTQRRKKVTVTNNVRSGTNKPSSRSPGLHVSSLQSSVNRFSSRNSNDRPQVVKNNRPGASRRRIGDEENFHIDNPLNERPPPKKNTSRNREPLNRLADERVGMPLDLSPYERLKQQNKAVKNKDNLAIQGSVVGAKKKGKSTSAEEIQREVERIHVAQRAQAKSNNRNTDLNAAGSGRRQRSNHVFNYQQPHTVTRTRTQRPTRPLQDNIYDDDDDDDYL